MKILMFLVSNFLIFFISNLFSNSLFAEDSLKKILNSSNVKIIIEEPYKTEDYNALYKKRINELRTHSKEQINNEPLLSGLKVINRVEKKDGIPFSKSDTNAFTLQSSDAPKPPVFDDSPLSRCSESLIVKRLGHDKKDQSVWLDSLYIFEEDLKKGKLPRALYGKNVLLWTISSTTSSYINKTLKAEGAKCLPFRHMIIGDTDLKIFGAAALVKR